jgi:exopolysaccharide production protein ExoZ
MSDGQIVKLQGLQVGRALAALSVAYYHSYMLLNGWPQNFVYPIPGLTQHGYLGVNFFFTISGFVISSVCDKVGFSPREFLVKRAIRLYPVYWAVVFLTIILKQLGVWMPGVSYKVGYILYSMTLLPQSGTPFYPVTWSLEYEVVFYFLAVVITPFFGLWGLVVVLFGLIKWAMASRPEFFTFHLVEGLNADFLAGVLAYLIRKPLSYIPATILVAAGIFGYYGVAVLGIPFSGSAGGLFLVSGLIGAKWNWSRRPLNLLVNIGDASYSLYLIHFILIWIPAVLFTHLKIFPPPWSAEPLRFAYLGACTWLSLQMWHRFEKPIIKMGHRFSHPSKNEVLVSDGEAIQPPAVV